MTLRELKLQLHSWIEKGDVKILKMLYAIAKVYFTANQALESEQTVELYRLVYTSSRANDCDEACIDNILESSRKNNPKEGITGILLHTEDRFLQILEGPLSNVMAAYNRIFQDKRHGGAQIRFCQPTAERYFSQWHMGSKDITEEGLSYDTLISKEERDLYASLVDGDLSTYKDDGMRILKTFLAIS
ncbi:MAG: BLUF domain-containing protein [Cyclobacteriaceae bacterium]